MKTLLFLAVIASGIATKIQAAPIISCASSLSPIEMTMPKLSSSSGNQYKGLIVIAVIIEKNGFISHSEIISENVAELDRGKFGDSGYSEAILDAVGKWRFPVVPNRCKKEVGINLSLSKN